jgi:hypothetical protein
MGVAVFEAFGAADAGATPGPSAVMSAVRAATVFRVKADASISSSHIFHLLHPPELSSIFSSAEGKRNLVEQCFGTFTVWLKKCKSGVKRESYKLQFKDFLPTDAMQSDPPGQFHT